MSSGVRDAKVPECEGLREPSPPPALSIPTLCGVGDADYRLPDPGQALSQRKLAEGQGQGRGPCSDLAPGAAGEGTKQDLRVRQTERECETDRQASRVSALPPCRANLTLPPCCLSFHPIHSCIRISLLCTCYRARWALCSEHTPPEHRRAHAGAHRCGRTRLQSPIAFPAETQAALHNLTDTPLSGPG